MSLPMLDMLNSDGWGLGLGGQARTSTIWPLKISNAFLSSGSFLKSSLSRGADPDFTLVGETTVCLPVLAGFSVAPANGGWGTGPGAGGAGANGFADNSSFMNFTCALGNPNSLILV